MNNCHHFLAINVAKNHAHSHYEKRNKILKNTLKYESNKFFITKIMVFSFVYIYSYVHITTVTDYVC